MGIILTAFSLFLMLIGSHAIGGEVKLTMNSDFKALLDAQWKDIEPVVPIRPGEDPGLGVFWQYRISPPSHPIGLRMGGYSLSIMSMPQV